MKSLSLFVSAAALLSASSAFAADINCATPPTCESLGYKDKKSECPASKFLACPFDANMGKCMHDAAIGDLKYSLNAKDHDGWLLCDGRTFSSDSTAKYHELFKVIGTNFCHKYTSKTDTNYSTSNCSGGTFAVPDYRGFFLRGVTYKREDPGIEQPSAKNHGYAADYMTGNLTTTPYLAKLEELPNITGDIKGFINMNQNMEKSGAFSNSYSPSAFKNGTDNKSSWWNEDTKIVFDASKSEDTYKTGGHVLPAHYAAYIFIYAGR